jgi:inositol transport system substrate-binding protein
MKKKISILLTIIMMFAIISGCGSKSSVSSNKNVKILFSVSDASDSFRTILTENAKSYAESENVDLTIMDAANSIEKQVEHMKEAVSGGYNVIICAPVDPLGKRDASADSIWDLLRVSIGFSAFQLTVEGQA